MNQDERKALLDFAQKLLSIDSPSGYTMQAMQFLQKEAEEMGFACTRSVKGNLMVRIPGASHEHALALSAHTDTLGLMVRAIKDNGMLAVTNIGGPTLPTLDSAYCRIYTRTGKTYTGTIVCTAAAKHVHSDASTLVRDLDSLEVRIDEVVRNKDEVQKLGIANGDIIAIDPKTCVTDSGFIKSRFLDDKISVACLFAVLKKLQKQPLPLKHDVIMIFSSYEEVGHGAAYIPPQVETMISVDMGCIGLDLACSEQDVSICAKDSSGPYDYALTSALIALAKQEQLPYAVDIYPMYSSDVSAALRAGNNIRGALIGPGVHASHGMERTHIDALDATVSLILAYLRTYA
ncbi:MAG TPA: M42 family metallopeptidase [Candidatus Merdibacter merdavium]|uniref:M42 family metallopeptidase n=1 Tax=Candidatus Merdibacter merdavium TaxID=2838692 RepID=A0A9D2NR85_9FIRM|nr:M42 family metallopeptidase [Candidatus Merdibacter merdavium]